ncbi:MAG: deoxyribose-phosphate aldolase [Synergistaceae bacterium]|jgi:deoxyribose-phosphate aldolase|nr:deoxyribose-phosphate aldolase [Synergistaceae bacterium]
MSAKDIDINEIIKLVTAEVCANFNAAGTETADGFTPSSLARYIDHTLLKPEASLDEIKKICDEAKRHHFASVCVNSCYIKFVADSLEGSGVAPCCVVGFPLGAMIPEAKAGEALCAVNSGAREIDMVINVGAAKSGDWKLVCKDIEGVVNAVRGRAIVKVIIETCLLSDEEKVKACAVSKLAGAHFVKTSTGFSKGGATVDDVKLMREAIGPEMGLKASGGVRTYEDAVNMIKAGATRLGTSSGVKLVSGGGAAEHKCVDCGACKVVCPSGRAVVLKGLC